MLIRQGLNFAAHMAAGVAFGALAVIACRAMKRRDDDHWREPERLERDEAPPADEATAARI